MVNKTLITEESSDPIQEFTNAIDSLLNPEWLTQSKEETEFGNTVIEVHAKVESLLDHLIALYFLPSRADLKKRDDFHSIVLQRLDYLKKVEILKLLGVFSNPKTERSLQGVNNYRRSQAHKKKDDPLRELTKQNLNKFSECAVKAYKNLIEDIMDRDVDLLLKKSKYLRAISKEQIKE